MSERISNAEATQIILQGMEAATIALENWAAAHNNLNNPSVRRFSEAWCFTWFGVDTTMMDHFLEELNKEKFRYMIVGVEHAPTTGRPHFQGYVRLAYPVSFERVRSWFSDNAHIEIARGTDAQNKAYCSKERVVVETGTPVDRIITRTQEDKMVMLMEDIRDRVPDAELRIKYPSLFFMHAQKVLQFRISNTCWDRIWSIPGQEAGRRDLRQKNYWIWGEPGTGKTRWARSMAPHLTYPKNVSKWWDGYNPWQHRVVVIDDWPAVLPPGVASALAAHLKLWGDRYPIPGEIKGSTMPLIPGAFFLIVTSNFKPEEVFCQEDYKAIKDRFTIWNITGQDDIRLRHELDFGILDQL